MPGITVGVDGSGHSQQALKWAVREAAIRQAPLTVVAVHQVASNHWTGNPIVTEQDRPEEEKIRKSAEEAVQQAVGELTDAKPPSVTVNASSGLPGRELIDASRDADLVVVGSRGAGGFARLMMGSVSNQVVNHAECPVVVVRHSGS
jgi:nucleotide-binding universal stress UspA family protein